MEKSRGIAEHLRRHSKKKKKNRHRTEILLAEPIACNEMDEDCRRELSVLALREGSIFIGTYFSIASSKSALMRCPSLEAWST